MERQEVNGKKEKFQHCLQFIKTSALTFVVCVYEAEKQDYRHFR